MVTIIRIGDRTVTRHKKTLVEKLVFWLSLSLTWRQRRECSKRKANSFCLFVLLLRNPLRDVYLYENSLMCCFIEQIFISQIVQKDDGTANRLVTAVRCVQSGQWSVVSPREMNQLD